MKSIIQFQISKKLLAVALLAGALVSCSENIMDDINRDRNHTTAVPSKFTLADVLTSSAFYSLGGDLNTYFSTYVEYETGTHNQLYRAEIREGEPSASTTFNNVWGRLYSTLKNARIIIKKCSEGGDQAGNNTTKGIAEVMAAINSALIADAFGDTPYSQAALPDLVKGQPAYMNPKIDTQQSIYTAVIKLLDDAIVDLPKGDKHPSGAAGDYDFIYKGNADKWLKLAYGLKARYTMRLMARSTDVAGDMKKVLEYVDQSFASASEQAAYAMYDATNRNPLFDFQWSRDGIAASKSMSDKLVARNDPRAGRVYYNPSSWEHLLTTSEDFSPAPNGSPQQSQGQYTYSVYVFAQTAPTLFMSYHELMFLKAEALVRLNRKSEAQEALKAAVVAAMANTEEAIKAAVKAPAVMVYGGIEDITADAITTEAAESYFTTTIVPLFEANPLKEVMIQKYIGLWGASGEAVETYCDIRRAKALNESHVELANTLPFPQRCPYGADDVLASPAVEAAFGNGQYIYSEPVWWAGGTR